MGRSPGSIAPGWPLPPLRSNLFRPQGPPEGYCPQQLLLQPRSSESPKLVVPSLSSVVGAVALQEKGDRISETPEQKARLKDFKYEYRQSSQKRSPFKVLVEEGGGAEEFRATERSGSFA